MMRFLDSPKTFNFLMIASFLSIITGFYLGINSTFPDGIGYLNMARSFGAGMFSSWYFLTDDYPETLRTWGYPFFLYLCLLISKNIILVQLVQLASYFAAVILILKIISHFKNEYIFKNIFLITIIPSIQLSFYTGLIAAESLTIFFVVVFCYVWLIWKTTYKKYLVLALVSFIIFQMRSAFLFFPFIFFIAECIINRNFKYAFSFLCLYILTLIPFGLWNLKNHNVFKVTPLEGGAGAAHLGYWAFKLPPGYEESYYWEHRIYKDIFQPRFYKKSYDSSVREYEREWSNINDKLSIHLSTRDSLMLVEMKEKEPLQFPLYSSKYTIEREKLLMSITKDHVKEDFIPYIATRAYTFCRLWFTGINTNFFKATSAKQVIQMIYPFLITFTLIFGGLIAVVFFFFKKILHFKIYFIIFLLIVYFGLIHTPFSIQARYTVPVHILILFLLSIGLGNTLKRKTETYNSLTKEPVTL